MIESSWVRLWATGFAAVLVTAAVAHADYETHPDLRPEERCAEIPPTVELSNGAKVLDWGETADPRFTDALKRPVTVDESVTVVGPIDAGKSDSLHCQKLVWDIDAAPYLGFRAAGSHWDADSIPRWPNGLTDRPPPMWVYDPDEDGVADACAPTDGPPYDTNPDCLDTVPDGFESPGPQRTALCPLGVDPATSDVPPGTDRTIRDPDLVPWWKPLTETNEEGTTVPLFGPDPERCPTGSDCALACNEAISSGNVSRIEAASACGQLFEVSCRRGNREYFGPWQTGTDPGKSDEIGNGIVRFENRERLDRDQARWDDMREPEDREDLPWLEWNTGTEIYNHFGSHHMTVWNAGNLDCNSPDADEGHENARDMELCGPTYQYPANPHDTPLEDGGPGYCWARDIQDKTCTSHTSAERTWTDGNGQHTQGDFDSQGNAFRNGTQLPGRLHVQLPDGRATPGLTDQLWPVEHHVVTQLPPGSYGLSRVANYRLQTTGLVNTSCTTPYGCEPRFGVEPWDYYGGTVAEGVFQYFTEAFFDPDLKPLSVMFEVVQDLATTYYPPFTWNSHQTVWYPPFDAAIGLITLHSHHRMVKGFTDLRPANPVRPNSPDPACGGTRNFDPTDPNGPAPARHLFVNWEWEDANVCEYWKEPDGPVIVRKGQAVVTTCWVNNGVTPEAIKRGLVAGSVVEQFREMGAEDIPEQPETVPAWSDDPQNPAWGNIVADSPLGQEILWGPRTPRNYRVKYQCGPAAGVSIPTPLQDGSDICAPNPKVDADGDYVDGPYRTEDCGTEEDPGWCNPASVVFANVGEDEMCIPVFMYWPLDRVLNGDGSFNEEVMENLDGALVEAGEGNPEAVVDWMNETGTPGRVWPSPSDAGNCSDGSGDEGPEIENPNTITGRGDCSIGL